jgi:hypothetical protein
MESKNIPTPPNWQGPSEKGRVKRMADGRRFTGECNQTEESPYYDLGTFDTTSEED